MMNFPFGTNGKFIILGVPILKHIRVISLIFTVSKIGFFGEMVSCVGRLRKSGGQKIDLISLLLNRFS